MTSPETLRSDILNSKRSALAQAITLIESTRPDHRRRASVLLDGLMPKTGKSIRIGISGVPGVGKSTLIDAFGSLLTGMGHKVAVLAVDPTSVRTGGSILGDKTRMTRLSNHPNAFIRPSPSSGTLGGVAARTRETMLLCEAAGFDIVIVETIGVGQSEVTVSQMVDLFLLLMLPGAGDELQGIKKGILEVADIIAVNKADGDNAPRARRAAADIRAALNILTPRSAHWTPPVVTVSGLAEEGLGKLRDKIGEFRRTAEASGEFAERRAEQNVLWLWAMLDEGLRHLLLDRAGLREAIRQGEAAVRHGERAPTAVVEAILAELGKR